MNAPHPTGVALVPSTETLDTLATLIGFRTVSRDSNLGLIEWARDRLAQLGARTRLTYDATGAKANLFATLGDGPKPGLVLSGHTDVVPVDGQAWETDPFTAVQRDGRIYGRGSADMKGFLAVALSHAPRFLEAMQQGRYDGPMHFALSYDEEIGCVGVRGLIADLAAEGIKPAGCIVGEPTNMSPVIAHKGKRDFCCRIGGREAHSAMTPMGVNAIEYAAKLIVYIRQMADRMAQIEARQYAYPVPFTTFSTNRISGGIANNVVPRDCELMFEFRYLPGTDPDALEREIRDYAGQLSEEMRRTAPEAGIAVELNASTPHLDSSEDAEIVKLAEALSRSAARAKVAYGTEAGLFQQAGIPSVICGPGSINVAHRPNEYVELEQLALCENFVQRLVGIAV